MQGYNYQDRRRQVQGKKRARQNILTLDDLPKTNWKYIQLIAQFQARYRQAAKERSKHKPDQKPRNFWYKRRSSMSAKKRFSLAEAKQIGDTLGIDWQAFDAEQFWLGIEVELEHGTRDAETNVTNDDPLLTGKIALAHLKEFPDYYTRLQKMETEADEFWAKG